MQNSFSLIYFRIAYTSIQVFEESAGGRQIRLSFRQLFCKFCLLVNLILFRYRLADIFLNGIFFYSFFLIHLLVCKYYNKPTPIPTQETIYAGDGLWSWDPDSPPYSSGLASDDIVKWATHRWRKTGTITTRLFNSDAISEIENYRPFFSMTTNPNHFRLCRGYINQDGYTYLRLNDPEPTGSPYGNPGLLERTYGSSETERI